MKQATWGLVLLLAAATIPACKSATLNGNAGSRTAEPLPQMQKLGYIVRWASEIPIPAGAHIAHQAILGDLLVTVEHPSNVVTAVSINDGSIHWRRKFVTSAGRLDIPLRIKNMIVINTETDIYHLNADTGNLVEITPLPTLVTSAPAIIGDLEVFGSRNSRVYGLEAKGGEVDWAYTMGGPITIRPVAVGGSVFVADYNGSFALLSAENGDLQWRSAGAFERVIAQPIYSPQTSFIYVASEDQNLYAINRSFGRNRWIFRATEPLMLDPILINNTLFVRLMKSGYLVAIDALTGNELWRIHDHLDPVAIVGQKVLAFGDNSLVSLDAATGAKTIQVDVRETIKAVLQGPDGSLVMIGDRGQVVRSDPQR